MNWNDYFDSEHHVKVMKDSIAEEKQAKKKLEDLMHTEEHINKTRTELDELNNKDVILLYGQSGSGKSTLANKFARDSQEAKSKEQNIQNSSLEESSKVNIVKSNAKREI